MTQTHRKPATERVVASNRVAAFVSLTKPRIVLLLLVTTLPAMFLAYEGVPALGLMAATLIGGSFAAMGANAANMVLDRDIDKIMQRTVHRPLPAGSVSARSATLLAVGLEAAAAAVFLIWVNVLSAALALGAAAFYIVVYTLWLKRRSPSNIVIGGAAGAVPPLVGWAAVAGSLAWAPVLLFAIVFFWTPPHFWALAVRYRDDYQAAGVPMLPVVASFRSVANRILVYTLIVVALSLVFAPVAGMTIFYFLCAAALGAAFIAYAIGVRKMLTTEHAMKLFFFSMLYVVALFGAITADVLLIS